MNQFSMKCKILLNLLGFREKKIFAIGFNKSGTSSLHALFNEINRPSYHGVLWRDLTDRRLLKKYDCFSDGTPDNLKTLDNLFPNSKYILQVRDLKSWVYSRLAHIDRYKHQEGYQTKISWDVTETAIKHWIVERNIYHKNTLNYFKDNTGKLIVVNFISDQKAATKVCNFLGYSGQWSRPKKNVNPETNVNPKYEMMLKNSIKELGIKEEELEYDILCPSLLENDCKLPYHTNQIDYSSRITG